MSLAVSSTPLQAQAQSADDRGGYVDAGGEEPSVASMQVLDGWRTIPFHRRVTRASSSHWRRDTNEGMRVSGILCLVLGGGQIVGSLGILLSGLGGSVLGSGGEYTGEVALTLIGSGAAGITTGALLVGLSEVFVQADPVPMKPLVAGQPGVTLSVSF